MRPNYCCACVRVAFLLGVHLLLASLPGVSIADDGAQDPDPKLLIEQLASTEFEVRRIAQEQLQGLGLSAFDPLLEAQFHPDVEVAHRARFILRSMAIDWVKESDPKDVKSILRGYGQTDTIERRAQIEALAKMEDQLGAVALCRLANYEFDPVLSKFAALQLMQMELTESPKAKQQMLRIIEAHVRPSQRPSALWLREYARWLASPSESLAAWSELVAAEKKHFEENSPNTSREIAGLLHLWYADALRSQSRTAASTEALRQTLFFLERDERLIRDAVMVMIDRDAHSIVDELALRFAEEFARNAHLSYLQAESLQSRPRPPGEEAPVAQINELVARAMDLSGASHAAHLELAEFLKQRGQFPWWEAESRFVLGAIPVASYESELTRNDLSNLLNELGRHDEAVEVLTPLAEEFSKVDQAELDPNQVFLLGRYHLFRARAAAQKRDFKSQKEQLKLAASVNIEDSDILIDMFRAEEADPNWKEHARNEIRKACDAFEKKLRDLDRELPLLQGGADLQLARTQYNIARACNQYAWLVANTEGDLDKALARSRQSLDISGPTAAYQDTLARCYYAKGDYQNALKYQRLALKQDPFAPAMRRQLALFEEAAKKSSPAASKE